MAISAMLANKFISSQLTTSINDIKFETLQNKFIDYEKKLSIIEELKEGDKLARSNNKIYFIHGKNEWFVQPRRWWSNQGREKTFQHLDEDFSEFMKYLNEILQSLIFVYENRYKDLAKSVRKCADGIITGLYNLKKTYPEEKKLLCKIDSIILTLIDFKSGVSEKLYTVGKIERKRADSD